MLGASIEQWPNEWPRRSLGQLHCDRDFDLDWMQPAQRALQNLSRSNSTSSLATAMCMRLGCCLRRMFAYSSQDEVTQHDV